MSGSRDPLGAAQDLERPTGWCRPGLFFLTALGVPALLVPGCAYTATLADSVWGAYAALAFAVVMYASLAATWRQEARRQGATSVQWSLGAMLTFALVILCVVALVVIYGLTQMGPLDMELRDVCGRSAP